MALEAAQTQDEIIIECIDSGFNAEATDYPKNALQFDDEHVYAVVMLGEDLIMEATIDTGSTKSLISKYFADELRTDDNIIKFNTAIKLANGSTITAEEALVIDIKLGNRRRRTKLLILPQVRDEIILGMDFLCGIDTTLQLCGEVIKLQHNDLTKHGTANINVNWNKNESNDSELASFKNNKQTINPTLLSEANSDYNISTMRSSDILNLNDESAAVKKTQYEIVPPTWICNQAVSKDEETGATSSIIHSGVKLNENEFHCLPLILQLELANIKQKKKKRIKFQREIDGITYIIRIKRSGIADVEILNTPEQQSDNHSIPINHKTTPNTNQPLQQAVFGNDYVAASSTFKADMQSPCMLYDKPSTPPAPMQPSCMVYDKPSTPPFPMPLPFITDECPPAPQASTQSADSHSPPTSNSPPTLTVNMPLTFQPPPASETSISEGSPWVRLTSFESIPPKLAANLEVRHRTKPKNTRFVREIDGFSYKIHISNSGIVKAWIWCGRYKLRSNSEQIQSVA